MKKPFLSVCGGMIPSLTALSRMCLPCARLLRVRLTSVEVTSTNGEGLKRFRKY